MINLKQEINPTPLSYAGIILGICITIGFTIMAIQTYSKFGFVDYFEILFIIIGITLAIWSKVKKDTYFFDKKNQVPSIESQPDPAPKDTSNKKEGAV